MSDAKRTPVIKIAYEDTFDVYPPNGGELRLGSVAPSTFGWAAYQRGQERRIGTYPTAEQAINAVVATGEEN